MRLWLRTSTRNTRDNKVIFGQGGRFNRDHWIGRCANDEDITYAPWHVKRALQSRLRSLFPITLRKFRSPLRRNCNRRSVYRRVTGLQLFVVRKKRRFHLLKLNDSSRKAAVKQIDSQRQSQRARGGGEENVRNIRLIEIFPWNIPTPSVSCQSVCLNEGSLTPHKTWSYHSPLNPRSYSRHWYEVKYTHITLVSLASRNVITLHLRRKQRAKTFPIYLLFPSLSLSFSLFSCSRYREIIIFHPLEARHSNSPPSQLSHRGPSSRRYSSKVRIVIIGDFKLELGPRNNKVSCRPQFAAADPALLRRCGVKRPRIILASGIKTPRKFIRQTITPVIPARFDSLARVSHKSNNSNRTLVMFARFLRQNKTLFLEIGKVQKYSLRSRKHRYVFLLRRKYSVKICLKKVLMCLSLYISGNLSKFSTCLYI